MEDHNESRRKLIKKAVYVAPAVVTLSAVPSFAAVVTRLPTSPPDEVIDEPQEE
jgi:hypothetical protein